jgi:hypothetical protein
MTYPRKSWIMAGAAAALLGGPAHAGATAGGEEARDEVGGGAAAAPARTVDVAVDGERSERGHVPAKSGEPVQLVFTRSGGPEKEEVVLPTQGIVAELPLGKPVALTVLSSQGGIVYSVQPDDARGAAASDALENEAGNTGGRG